MEPGTRWTRWREFLDDPRPPHAPAATRRQELRERWNAGLTYDSAARPSRSATIWRIHRRYTRQESSRRPCWRPYSSLSPGIGERGRKRPPDQWSEVCGTCTECISVVASNISREFRAFIPTFRAGCASVTRRRSPSHRSIRDAKGCHDICGTSRRRGTSTGGPASSVGRRPVSCRRR